MIVAIDGPAASGKSTVSRAVAKAIGGRYLDTGAMYRAAAWAVLEAGVDPDDEDAVGRIAGEMALGLVQPTEEPFAAPRVMVGEVDVTEAIRGPAVNAVVSRVARVPAVRRELVARQRAMVGDGPAVVEGRDIATVVFPDAGVKVFLTAQPEERIRRRRVELEAAGIVGADEAHGRVLDRDRIDSTRADSPLARAPDATVIDTTSLDVDGVVQAVLALVRATEGRPSGVGQRDD